MFNYACTTQKSGSNNAVCFWADMGVCVCVRMCAIELNECLAFTLIELDLLNEAISISTN